MEPRPGRIEALEEVEVRGFPRRTLRLYRPAEDDGRTPRPILYLFDGQNVFGDEGSFAGGWQVHRVIDGLDRRWYAAPFVVAIPSSQQRQEELTPWPMDGRGGEADRFLDWVTFELVPALRRRLPVIDGPVGHAVGGSSWGGLTALYAHLRNPEQWGGALSLSPSAWVANFRIFDVLRGLGRPAISRIYLDCGALEAGGRMLPAARALADELRARGYRRDELWWRPDPRGAHDERAWARRLPRALRFMYRNQVPRAPLRPDRKAHNEQAWTPSRSRR